MTLGSFTLPVRAFIAALAFAGALFLAQPFAALAQPDKTEAVPPQEKQYGQKLSPERIEQRIARLHDELKITSAQESAWKDFAQVMRDNATAMHASIQKWMQNRDKMTAPESMKAYSDMAEEHVKALSKLSSVFDPLYNSMSPDQKKNADMVFSHEKGPSRHKGKKQ